MAHLSGTDISYWLILVVIVCFQCLCLQCFHTVSSMTERACGL